MGNRNMKELFTFDEAAATLGVPNRGGADIYAITTDSRETESGALFVALRGERFDGNDFVGQAVARGASAVVAERLPEGMDESDSRKVFVVRDSLEALGRLAAAYRTRIAPKVIAVTGSVGKTTTKEFVSAVCGSKYQTHKSEGNFNSEIGMPLSILSMPQTTQVCVLEMGMSQAGEIGRMTRAAMPDIAIITNIGNSHIENLGSRENICKAKLEIVEGMSGDGCVILNADEPLLFAKKGTLKQRTLFVSLINPTADYRALNIREYEDSTDFDLVAGTRVVTNVHIPTIGLHNVYDATFAFAAGVEAGMSDEEIKRGLRAFRNTGMRQNIYEYGGCTIIEDCYNAGPESMKAALEVLASVAEKNKGRSIAVLGDMRELGEYSKQLHMEVGKLVASRHISKLITFGREAENIALGAINHAYKPGDISINNNIEAPALAARAVCDAVLKGDVILFKASRAVRLERVIAEFKRMTDENGAEPKPQKTVMPDTIGNDGESAR